MWLQVVNKVKLVSMNIQLIMNMMLILFVINSIFLLKSDQQPLTPISSRQWDNQSYDNWCTALRCKQNVGTQEWINCKQTPCVKLREELHHLLVCRYRCVGGCEHRCMHLRQELQYCRELLPKHPTVKEEHLKTRLVF